VGVAVGTVLDTAFFIAWVFLFVESPFLVTSQRSAIRYRATDDPKPAILPTRSNSTQISARLKKAFVVKSKNSPYERLKLRSKLAGSDVLLGPFLRLLNG